MDGFFGEFDGEEKPKRNPTPSIEEMKIWVMEGVAEATDGCHVEPDGQCEHECNSWLLELGYI